MHRADGEALDWDVTALVQRWLTTSQNRGFALKTDNAYAMKFVGRTADNQADRPQLEVVTDQGTFTPPTLANAQYSASSVKPTNSRDSFKASNNEIKAIVLFDLRDVKGQVSSTTLSLTVTEMKYASDLLVFEADPPLFRLGGGGAEPVLGIAKDCPLDKGIDKRPSVLFSADFSDVTSPTWGGSCKGTQEYDPETDSTYQRGIGKPPRAMGDHLAQA